MHCLWCHSSFVPKTNWQYLFGITTKTYLCPQCSKRLEEIQGPLCDKCGRPFNHLEPQYRQENLCTDCVRWGDGPLTKNRSLYVYNDFLQEVISKWKFRGDAELSKLFTPQLKKLIKQLEPFDFIVPIPLSYERSYERGFNQAKLLTEGLQYPIVEALVKPINSTKQSKKTRSERLEQKELFHISSVDVTNKTILLVDDIYTTGATLYSAAKILKEHGAKKVFSVTVARG
ncbi:ComF family protein [Anaerobacillus alkaliphilus]|uniref:ComF family protein n=1 Tax=Anaerobacillus alkaliphilus TaxID=1548597 RepID=A0A4Q0VVY6_9BACI|nr:ComF family protein [Anaerobacillus alkaliphilus]RXJ02290.1 ComF family protein [Anaerobacillus alkaliphilus]